MKRVANIALVAVGILVVGLFWVISRTANPPGAASREAVKWVALSNPDQNGWVQGSFENKAVSARRVELTLREISSSGAVVRDHHNAINGLILDQRWEFRVLLADAGNRLSVEAVNLIR